MRLRELVFDRFARLVARLSRTWGGRLLAAMATPARDPLTVDNVKSHARRDKLLEIQAQVQKRWADSAVFNVDAPAKPVDVAKYTGNFPYPYMNGLLHLGHAFTISKVSE